MTPREDIRQRHARALLHPDPMRPGVTMHQLAATMGDMLTAVTAMVEDNGDQWRLALIGLSDQLERSAREMKQRARRLPDHVRKEMRTGHVVHTSSGNI